MCFKKRSLKGIPWYYCKVPVVLEHAEQPYLGMDLSLYCSHDCCCFVVCVGYSWVKHFLSEGSGLRELVSYMMFRYPLEVR